MSTILDFTAARDNENGSGVNWNSKTVQSSNLMITCKILSFIYMPFLSPSQQHESTECS